MQQNPKRSEKLEPLRRYCIEELYSTRYLSIIVQRGRLKAKKIGRNYFTCQAWFEEYLQKYATEEKRVVYYNHLARQTEKHAELVKKFKDTPLEKLTYSELELIEQSRSEKVNFFIAVKNNLNIKKAAVIAAVFVLLFSGLVFVPRYLDNRGQISGVEEEAIQEIATSSQEIIVDYGAVRFGD